MFIDIQSLSHAISGPTLKICKAEYKFFSFRLYRYGIQDMGNMGSEWAGLCTSVCYCMPALVTEGVWLFSACAKDDVHARICEHRAAHVSHFESKGSILKRLLHLSCNTRGGLLTLCIKVD